MLLDIFSGGRSAHPHSARYSPRSIMTPAERSFFGVLEMAGEGRCRIFTKVRLADLLKVETRSGWQSHFNRITSKHVDFVICEPSSLAVMCVVELDDSSHKNASSSSSDLFKDHAFASAGVRLIRISVRKGYSVADLRAQIFPAIGHSP
jgi:very-short-patch-repair endonuclease